VIPSLRNYLTEIDGSLMLDKTYIRKQLRVNDIAIMDIVCDSNMTEVQEHRVNCVRLFLGIMYSSEICSIDGRCIRDGIKDGSYKDNIYDVRLKKARQKRPNTASWKLWTRVIESMTTDGTRLKQPLGEWTQDHSTSGTWNAYQDGRQVYELIVNENGEKNWNSYWQRGSLIVAQNTIPEEEFNPNTGIPIAIHSYPGAISTRSLPCTVSQSSSTPRKIGPTECWDSFIQLQPDWIRLFLQEIHFYSDDGFANIDEILKYHDKFEYLLLVSDGSVKFHNMTFGWIIATPDGHRLAAGAGPCQGRGNSLRSEGAGMLSRTLFLALISNHMDHSITTKCISDNKELIRRMNEHKQYDEPFPNATLASEYDIIEEIYNTCKIYNIKSSYQWVRGHQDKDKEYDDLPLDAQLNVDADYYAGLYQDNFGQFLPHCTLLPTCRVMLSIRNISITSDYKNQLIRAYTEPKYIEYLQNRFGWADDVIGVIAWKCLALATRRISRTVILTKVCNDLLPTAVTLQEHKYQHHNRCSVCDCIET